MAARKAVFEYVTDYFQRVLQPDFPASFPFKSKVWKMADILPEKPGSVDNLLSQFKEKLELNGAHDGCARLIAGFNPNSGNYPSALGMLYMMLADIHNHPEWRVLDQMVLQLLLRLIGYGDEASGFLTSGGSSASIVSFMAAREASGIPMADSDRAVVYLTDTVHMCADKALKAVGLSRVIFRLVRYDSQRKMVLSDLEENIRKDLENGLYPLMIAVTIGQVESGAIDPLAGIADIAAKYDMWLHVDAAYGGFFLLCDEVKEKTQGIERANSVIVSLHKGLFQPYGSAAVLLKNGGSHSLSQLYASHPSGGGSATTAESFQINPLEDSPPFRGFPAWMFLNTLGLKHMRAVTMEKMQVADYMYNFLKMCPGIWAPIKPELSKVIFAMDDDDVETANRKTDELCEELNKDRQVMIDTTKTDGRVFVHTCVSSFRSHLSDVEIFLRKLKKVVEDLFYLKLPEIGDAISKDREKHLRRHEETYVGLEREMAKTHFPVHIANAAGKYKNNQQGLKERSGLDAYTLPLVGKLQNHNMNKNAKSYVKMPSTIPLDLPEDPRSLDEITNALSCFPAARRTAVLNGAADSNHDETLLEPAILGHFLAACTNRYSAMRSFSSGHTELEEIIPDWLRTVAGFPDTAKGVLCNDSCSADSLCLHSARCHKLPHPRMYGRAVVYGTSGSLQRISQPLHVLGLSRCQRSVVDSTDGRMDTQTLMTMIQDDLEDTDRIPFLVALSIKPSGMEANPHELKTLVALCQEAGIWVHIHVSGGAPYLLASLGHCEAMTLSGLCEADSISINLTKCLCQPQEVAAVLVRDQRLLLNSVQPQRIANYFRDITTIEYEPAAYSLELTRPSRAVAVWFAMYLHGAEKLRKHIATLQSENKEML